MVRFANTSAKVSTYMLVNFLNIYIIYFLLSCGSRISSSAGYFVARGFGLRL